MRFLVSPLRDPYLNIAMEKELMSSPEEILFLWRNDPVVIFGRNQNVYAEVNMDYAARQGILVARRYSGGGAVYQDPGNLNYSWITPSEDPSHVIGLITEAMQAYGLNVVKSGRNDLLINGRKFSGMASHRDGGNTLFHGTLLVHVDTEKLAAVLNPSQLKLRSKGITSVSARVANLSQWDPSITVESLTDTLAGLVGLPPETAEADAAARERAAVLRSPAWIYGQDPRYEVTEEVRLPGGIYQFNLLVENGLILDANIYTDDLTVPDLSRMKQDLIGQPFSPDLLKRAGKR